MIAEAKNLEALRFDHGRSSSVGSLALIGKMLSAIELDHELGGVADEVCDEVLDRDLAAQAGAIQTMVAEL
jgi:hypothetical protein